MNIKERIRAIRLMNLLRQNPEYGEMIGIEVSMKRMS